MPTARGMIRIGQYAYTTQLKSGLWAIYTGAWSDRGFNNVTGLTVVRDADNKPQHFSSLEEARKYATNRGI